MNTKWEMMKILECEIKKQDILEMGGPVYFAEKLRIILKAAGFKFEDDNLMLPLGKIEMEEDPQTGTRHYKQTIDN